MIKRKFHILLLLLVLGCLLACEISVPEAWRDNPLFSEDEEPPPGDADPSGEQADPGEPTTVSDEDGGNSGNTGGTDGTDDTNGMDLKPVCFLNTGTAAATVMAWTFIPIGGGDLARPSDASTVAFPGGNSSACLSLPLGTYTWCYHWEHGDLDGDGYMDYFHAIDTRSVILDESDTGDLDLAERVGLSVPPGFNELPGRCGQAGTQVIEWGDEVSTWSVSVLNGAVVSGTAQGNDAWTAVEGTYEGTTIYVVWQKVGGTGCSSTMEQWFTVGTTTVTHERSLTGCGVDRVETIIFERWE